LELIRAQPLQDATFDYAYFEKVEELSETKFVVGVSTPVDSN